MKLIMVRHGETEANVSGIYSGWTNYSLTAKGEKQVKKVVEYLKHENIDVIYSSPLDRALKIAKAIADETNKDIEIVDSLREINFGIFEGKTHEEIKRDHKDEYKNWSEDYVNYRVSQGESLRDLHDRINEFVNELKKTNEDKTYLLVTHGGTIGVLITILLGLDMEKMWNFKIPPGSVAEIEYNQGFGVLAKLINT